MRDKYLYIDTPTRKQVKTPLKYVISKLQPGDILLEGQWCIAGIISVLIQLITKCRYAHAAIYFDKGLILEAKFPDVQMSKLSCYAKKVSRCRFFRAKGLDVYTSLKIINSALDKIDAGYDKELIFMYLWRIMLGTLGKAPMPDDHTKYVCSELVAQCFHENGIKIGGEYPDNVLAKDILESPLVEEIKIVEN